MSEPDQSLAEKTTKKFDSEAAKAVLKAIPHPSRRRKRRDYDEASVVLRFTSCGRCGLFLAAYRLDNERQFNEAITEIEADWLPIPWYPELRDLVNKSYGCPIDIESYYFEGSCPECLRPFGYAEPDPDQPAWFLIKL